MRILFVYANAINPLNGGVEKVTFSLASYFESKGHKILFLCSNLSSSHDLRQIFLPDVNSVSSTENISFFRNILINNSIDIIINQSGTDSIVSSLLCDHKIDRVKLISVIHNSPIRGVLNFGDVHKAFFLKFYLGWILKLIELKFFKYLLVYLYKLKYSKHYIKLCEKSDRVVLLSDSYIAQLKFFINKSSLINVLSIPNPAPFDNIGNYTKKRELLYVGRINTTQKRLDILLQIWKILHNKFEEWSLNVIGDGEELDLIKQKSKELNLTNIYFHGECDPRPFYESASIFCLTSSFEGLPMTLLESMQFGVVPIAFNSFSAVIDLIDNGVNGYVIEPFNIDEYVNKISRLISNEHDLVNFSKASLDKIRNFDLEQIGAQWDCLFDKLNIRYNI